ncbi:hypothetical protein BIV57_20230 [Mangrovactinospora gilvigrisea]|uniref:NAD(P)-binding domain-containing protein n=1 Tax=Mangrovactinospora gilvigrisea TaxID=1428644 RepID=A0A1J7BAP2_9ACTN|nr:NAD(P)H-binding protein [Mangrovactinospora gilvigrisea]OIV35686.1 hypothetical protein BIV57_20230 [Mangrovactinospora gilvigrisea]
MAQSAESAADGGGAVLVTGGTGTLGGRVVRQLAAAGRPVRLLSRRPRPAERADGGVGGDVEWCTGDLATGAGLAEAVAGVAVVVNCASDVRHMGKTDPEGVRRLAAALRAAKGDGAPARLVHVSIVGIDRAPFPYYRRKLAAEREVEASGLPWTILRATQFHDLVASVSGALGRLPVVPVPSGVNLRPVDSGEVAARLVELAAGPAAARAADFGGPEVRALGGLVRAYLRAAGTGRRSLAPLPLPGRLGRALRAGALVTPDREGVPEGRRTFEEYLADRFGG